MIFSKCARRVLLSLLVCVGVLLVCVGPAFGEVSLPWYRVSSVSLPGNLVAGRGRSAVLLLTVSATEGIFAVVGNGKGRELEWNVSHEALQATLEELYGAGNVEVPKGEGNEEGSDPYEIVFKGAMVDQAVKLRASSESLECNGAVGPGCKASAKVTAKVQGRSDGYLVATVVNVGDATANFETAKGGVPVVVTDMLPAGLKARSIEGGFGREAGVAKCEVATLTCRFARGTLSPFVEQLEVTVGVSVLAGAASGEANTASVSGGEGFVCHEVKPATGVFTDSACLKEEAGGSFEREATGVAPAASTSHPIVVSSLPTPFGVEDYEVTNEEAGGGVDTHAGSHPFQTTFTLNLNEALASAQGSEAEVGVPAALPKDLTFKLPAGFIGDPSAYERCSLAQFSTQQCPADSVLGVASVIFHEEVLNRQSGLGTSAVPIFNLEPSIGEPARFGIKPDGVPAFIDTSVRTGEDYGITAHVQDIPQTIGFLANTVTFWGVPGDARHNDARGTGCLDRLRESDELPCSAVELKSPPPFLSLPTSCTGSLESTVEGDSWEQPGVLQPPVKAVMPGLDGCGSLQFAAEIGVSPNVEAASTPTGLKIDVHVPQEEALNAQGYAPADVRNLTVALPEGLELNPAAADGLEACTLEQVGLSNADEATCPNASKVATVTIKTPLLPAGQYLHGFIYLASPQNFAGPLENPFGSLVAMYLVAKDPISGVLVKQAGHVQLSATGQLTGSFPNIPQLPFEDAEVEFFGGERAPLATPAHCGSYTTSATLEPWTNNETIHEALHATSTFNITTGLGGGACPAPALPFAPSLVSETTNINAGAFTPLSTTLSREDGQQNISAVTLHYPPGVSGYLTGVKLCPEAQANAGTCSPESLIGETIVSVGLGGDPFTVTGGHVYLTEKYDGAPFGLSIVNPAKAGPFILQEGRPVVVRARVEIDPHTAALTITTDPAGSPHAIPTIIEGIPLQIKHVNVTITRPGFTINPTNCSPMSITGTVNSAEGAAAPVEIPFQVTNCAALKFTPAFTASTSGKTSKLDGASLTLKVTRPTGPASEQANFTKAKIELPTQLPSRLTTLQKACLAAVFEKNPAACPAGSVVGHAKVTTPIIPVPLEGPAYFVSHGNEAFPSLTMVLQGYGITIQVISATFIKDGITSGTINAAPDQPFTTFELTLPEGPDSALAANANLCKTKPLQMPTEFVAQNGIQIHQTTTIKTTSCPKTKTRKQKLQAALNACKHKHHKHACETQAHKKYGPNTTKHHK
jgi:hypothetical protein